MRPQIGPEDFKSVVIFLTRRIIDKHLRGYLFASAARSGKRDEKGKGGNQVFRRKT